MEEVLSDYHVNLATWFYLSLLLIIAVYFRFNRIWSVRNLDLVLLLSLSPGLLLVEKQQTAGFVWLFVVSALLLLRLFCDGLFERRPKLEQNLNLPALSFLGIAAFVFLMTKVVTEEPPPAVGAIIREGERLRNREDVTAEPLPGGGTGEVELTHAGPASKVLAAGATTLSEVVADEPAVVDEIAPRVLAIVSHLAVIVGLIILGKLHFGELHLGVAMAALYVLLPCTASDVGKVNHVLPAALILWAFVSYRRPMLAGALMGLACGTVFFPIFLLPLWAAFYDRRGALRFGLALGLVMAVLVGSLVFTSANAYSFTQQLLGSIDWSVLKFRGNNVGGFWTVYDEAYRIPVFVTFVLMLVALTVWPRRKTLEHLLAHSGAIVVGTQFWYPQQGGVYILWYLPLVLIVVFRPRLLQHVPPGTEPVKPAAQFNGERTRRRFAAAGTPGGPVFR